MTLDEARFLLAMPHLHSVTPEQLHELVTAHSALAAEAYQRGRAEGRAEGLLSVANAAAQQAEALVAPVPPA